jgi:hypothetical protein
MIANPAFPLAEHLHKLADHLHKEALELKKAVGDRIYKWADRSGPCPVEPRGYVPLPLREVRDADDRLFDPHG